MHTLLSPKYYIKFVLTSDVFTRTPPFSCAPYNKRVVEIIIVSYLDVVRLNDNVQEKTNQKHNIIIIQLP